MADNEMTRPLHSFWPLNRCLIFILWKKKRKKNIEWHSLCTEKLTGSSITLDVLRILNSLVGYIWDWKKKLNEIWSFEWHVCNHRNLLGPQLCKIHWLFHLYNAIINYLSHVVGNSQIFHGFVEWMPGTFVQ